MDTTYKTNTITIASKKAHCENSFMISAFCPVFGGKLGITKTVLYISILLILFFVPAKSQNLENIGNLKPFEIKGSLSARTIFFKMNGRESYREPFTWLLQGSPTIYIYGIAIPVTIVVSDQERDFRQSFNRFGFSPQYKWARLYLGFQNLQFSRYSMADHSIVGAGIELTPGKLRFAYMHGQLLRAVQTNPYIDDQDYRLMPSFKRTADVIKLGFGTEDNFVDFIALKGGDIRSSLDSIPADLKPAENLVVSLNTEQRIFKKLRLSLEYAESYYTEDINSEGTTDKGDVLKPFDLLFTERTSTVRSTAIKGNLKYQGDVFFGDLEYERIDPLYRSMGAYFFLNDIQRYTINPGIKILDSKITLKTSFGYQENNLDNSKEQRTIRKVYGVFVTARAGDIYQFTGNYSNFGVEQKQVLDAASQAIEIAQVTEQWNMNHSINFTGESHLHNINLNLNRQNLNDNNEMAFGSSDYTSSSLSINYMVSFLNARLSANAGFTYSGIDVALEDIAFYGPSLGVNKSFFKNKMQLSFNGNYLINQRDSEKLREITRLMMRASYKVNRSQQVALRGQYGKNEFIEHPDRSYEEIKIEMSYGIRF